MTREKSQAMGDLDAPARQWPRFNCQRPNFNRCLKNSCFLNIYFTNQIHPEFDYASPGRPFAGAGVQKCATSYLQIGVENEELAGWSKRKDVLLIDTVGSAPLYSLLVRSLAEIQGKSPTCAKWCHATGASFYIPHLSSLHIHRFLAMPPTDIEEVASSDMDEETALLSRPERKPRTPLPKLQLSIIMLVQICEPLASQSIYPYINQLISELDITGGDEKKVGYYASLSKQPQFKTRTDPLLLLAIAILCNSVSDGPAMEQGFRLHWKETHFNDRSLRVRVVNSLFWIVPHVHNTGYQASSAPNIRILSASGVMKSAMGDLTDRSNRAEGFAYLPSELLFLPSWEPPHRRQVVWAVGASVGPLIGGSLARPHDRFPELFPGRFWQDFPYFLPCLVVGSVVLLSCFLVFALFKESVPSRNRNPQVSADETANNVRVDDLPPTGIIPKRSGPRPLRELLIFPVVISISNYVALGFLNTTLGALLPLFLAMPIEIGGLGLPPPKIGLIISAYGLATGLFQALLFARFVRRFGERRVFINGMITCLPVFTLFPIINFIARHYGLTSVVYALVGCVLALGALMDTAFGAIFIFVTAAAPISSRGTVNGLSQTSVSVARAIGPAMSTSLFSISVQHNLLGGYMVYLVFFLISGVALGLAGRLPEEVWDDVDD
ncbi:major facilitator superfamily domain-containing protein [Mycena metata]|uniref:Major facilitator superfamily domain-containing protein n=1 Tax=Mycena metata TaxID=1033252 RepID=A0AAD7IMQ1_9AGAR|nr:major facilitator superfamily domain-containing protein [Mycena metata]